MWSFFYYYVLLGWDYAYKDLAGMQFVPHTFLVSTNVCYLGLFLAISLEECFTDTVLID